jgi:phosphatidylglycerol:prolipoprotein diacylglycerol transferase
MFGPFVHDIDPVIGAIGGLYLWWYGLTYTLGFLVTLIWLRLNRAAIALSVSGVYTLTLFIAAGVLLGGRLFEVVFYEWAYYGSHLTHIPAIWLGGMSTHGILAGGIVATLLFCRIYRRSFFEISDMLVIAGAFIMGFGRIGNFIDGQIVGAVSEMPWSVKFPDLEGFRHPVVLYDGLKNLLLIPFLLLIRKMNPPRGVLTAHFILWYGFLRVFVDIFREYRTNLYGLPPGQEFNILMALTGVGMLLWFYRNTGKERSLEEPPPPTKSNGISSGLGLKRLAFILLLLIPTIIPSDWTQDVPARYGARHPGMTHSWLYPPIGEEERG